jgi:hypothetical protein
VGGSRWLVLISGIAMVTEEEIALARRTYEVLAEKAGGDYDGWEPPRRREAKPEQAI